MWQRVAREEARRYQEKPLRGFRQEKTVSWISTEPVKPKRECRDLIRILEAASRAFAEGLGGWQIGGKESRMTLTCLAKNWIDGGERDGEKSGFQF